MPLAARLRAIDASLLKTQACGSLDDANPEIREAAGAFLEGRRPGNLEAAEKPDLADDRRDRVEVAAQVGVGNRAAAEALLRPLIAEGDIDAMGALGTLLTLGDIQRHPEGVALLERAVAAGSGYAAHNLAVHFQAHGPQDRVESLFSLAVNSGFEATVSGDPYWWRR
ncbi:MAG: hypothetical protein HOW73_40150 [Polyangiaceae bacterium]|nr:hypothetical protein [Polyangiaceae bacterium]